MVDIPFEREMEFSHGEMQQVSPLIRRLVAPNPSAFTFRGTNTYIVGRGNIAVIDPGPDDDAHLEAILRAIGSETVTHIVVSHTHRDHSPLAARLKAATGAPTIAFGPHGSGGGGVSGITSGSVQLDASGDTDFQPDQRIAHGEIIDGDGWHLEAVFTPGHTANHMGFALKEENALFSADHVMAWSTSVIAPPDGNMADYMASLRLLLDRDDEIYWPGHGPAKTNPRPFVRAFITHRQMREQAIFERIKGGDRRIMDVVQQVYRSVDPKLHPAAAMSALAHIEHLIQLGRVRMEGSFGLDAEFYPAP